MKTQLVLSNRFFWKEIFVRFVCSWISKFSFYSIFFLDIPYAVCMTVWCIWKVICSTCGYACFLIITTFAAYFSRCPHTPIRHRWTRCLYRLEESYYNSDDCAYHRIRPNIGFINNYSPKQLNLVRHILADYMEHQGNRNLFGTRLMMQWSTAWWKIYGTGWLCEIIMNIYLAFKNYFKSTVSCTRQIRENALFYFVIQIQRTFDNNIWNFPFLKPYS